MNTQLPRKLLLYSPSAKGGIADYCREQAHAISQTGVEVNVLTKSQFRSRSNDTYRLLPKLSDKPSARTGALLRLRSRLGTAQQILCDIRGLTKYLAGNDCSHVLFSAYAEYLAPLWAGSLRRLARDGTVFGAIVHDPVRHAVVGPLWWHRRSIAAGYSFLREAFVHEPVELDTVRPQPQMTTTVIPHGMYAVTPPQKSADQMRAELNLPAGTKLLLSFGHIKDYKNLDLTIRALAQLPDFYVLVAGQESVSRERPISYYRELAVRMGVAERCRWCVQHIPEAEIGNYFAAADLVLLTYNRAFRSASGVLNLAVGYRKPCVASSGPSNLQTVVKNYGLGIWVEPDSEPALLAGIRQWQTTPTKPAWARYEQEHSWARNAELVIERLFQ